MITIKPKKFKAILHNDGSGADAAYVVIPFNVERTYGSKGMVKVKATFDGHPYRGVVANMGHGHHIIGVRKDIRKIIGKAVGDAIQVTIEPDFEERKVTVPPDMQALLGRSQQAKIFFEGLSYTNRKEYALWIASAKRPETKEKRLSQLIPRLLAGKKNPSA